jgi:drug/metabolite transporter (DMT)-like permease
MKKYRLIIIPIVMIAVGQIFSKMGADRIAHGGSVINLFVLLGYAMLFARGLLWIFIIRGIHLSAGYPCISLSFILILLLSHAVFNEPITAPRVLGSVIILLGVLCIGLGERRMGRTDE